MKGLLHSLLFNIQPNTHFLECRLHKQRSTQSCYCESEPYQPHSIPPSGGAHAVTGAPKFNPSPLSRPEKTSIPKLKYEALEISEVRGPFERKVPMHYNYFGPFWKQCIYTLQLLMGAPLKAKKLTYTLYLLLGPFESKVVCTLQL